ncbi:MAG TPA: DNA-binding protein WhiA [Candidatus Atribacteria bacterium]|nr:DNA-binding protein WhiA [Candidatus Atribacteria bacterium]
MLFFYRVKNELARIVPKNIYEKRGELLAFIQLRGRTAIKDKKMDLNIILEDPAITRTAYNLIKQVFKIHPVIKTEHLSNNEKHYVIEISLVKGYERIFQEFNQIYEQSIKEKRFILNNNFFSKVAYLRGAFLVNGFVNDPEKMYHLEISVNDEIEANFIHILFNFYHLNSRVSFWKKKWLVYLKKGDSIFEFLRLIGVQNALLYYQDIRARKDMVNTVNRLVNCETANLDKTIFSAVEQLHKIDIIERKVGLKNIPPKLAKVAEIRKKLPYASLREMVEEVDYEITKSGIYHRLKKISQIADELLES